MDSLLSTYASSDDDDEQPPPPPPPPSSKSTTSLFSSLPKPSSSPPSSRLFSSLPPPKPSSSRQDIIPPNPIPKKVKVQFHPPQLTNNVGFRDDDEDEVDAEEREAKKRRQLGNQDSSVKSFLSSIPAPKNSGSAALGGALGGPSGGRRSIIDASVPVSTPAVAPTLIESISEQDVGISQPIAGNDEQYYYNNVYNYDVSSYGNYEGYEQQYYDGNEAASLGEAVQGMSSGLESFMKMGGGGKRRKDQPPVEILEVKQDELMKNRPTEDKSKLTGMAFGPSYQPASSKGKPSKLHKRKHQISSLYFDMRAKEPEFQERRAKGFLTKAETQAKYGW